MQRYYIDNTGFKGQKYKSNSYFYSVVAIGRLLTSLFVDLNHVNITYNITYNMYSEGIKCKDISNICHMYIQKKGVIEWLL